MDFLPVSVRINGRSILIVGGGKVATHKAQILHRFTDQATVIAPEVSDALKQLPFTVIERPFEEGDLEGVQLLFVCTGDAALKRCRTIGDITCTGLTESKAHSVEDIIEEIAASRVTERGGRADDKRSETAMEDRKKAGYF